MAEGACMQEMAPETGHTGMHSCSLLNAHNNQHLTIIVL